MNFPRKIPAPGPPKGRCASLGPALPWTIDTRTKRLQKAEFCFWPVLPLPCRGTGRCGVNSGAQVCLQPLPGPSRNAPSHILPLEHGQGGTAPPRCVLWAELSFSLPTFPPFPRSVTCQNTVEARVWLGRRRPTTCKRRDSLVIKAALVCSPCFSRHANSQVDFLNYPHFWLYFIPVFF